MVKKLVPDTGTEKILLRERGGSHGIHFATLLTEDAERLKGFEWFYDAADKQAYRVIEKENGKKRSFLHREAGGYVFGDGNVIGVKDENWLNCIRSNIELLHKRPPIGNRNGRRNFPSEPKNFINFVSKNFKNSQIHNFLELAEIKAYSKKEIVFHVEIDDDKPVSGVQSVIQRFMVDNFGFKGRVAVIRKPIELLETKPADKPVPVAASPVQAVPSLAVVPTLKAEPMPAVVDNGSIAPAAIMARIHELSRSGTVEFLSFGVREGKKLHKFNYTCEETPQEAVQ